MLKIKRVIHSRKKMFTIAGRYNDSKFACHLKRYKAKPKRTKRRNRQIHNPSFSNCKEEEPTEAGWEIPLWLFRDKFSDGNGLSDKK